MPSSVITLNTQPGIQRDGTQYNSKNYIDGQWVRFYLGRPLKIAGYKLIDQGNNVIVRTLFNYNNPSDSRFINTYIGREDSISYATFDLNGEMIGGEVDRTPSAPDFTPDPRNLWDIDAFTDASGNPSIIAHVAFNANDSSNSVDGKIYAGSATGAGANTPLALITSAPQVSGGIIFIAPVLVAYGNGGIIQWSEEGSYSVWPGNFKTIANTKIIKILLVRGSIQPQALAWTANSIISLTYAVDPNNPTENTFLYTTIDNTITLMSANCIVGYASQYFWMGINQFYLFNGTVIPLENTMNAKYLFDRIYLPSRSKVFAEIVTPSNGLTEFWWHVPLSKPEDPTPSENNHVFMWQYKGKVWADTPLSRAAGTQEGTFPRPIMSDAAGIQIVTRVGVRTVYPLWMHEIGVDQVIDEGNTTAIRSFFETHIFDLFEGNPSLNRAVRTRRVEPDFEMNGHMTITINNRFFPSDTLANGRLIQSGPYTFDVNTPKIDAINSQGRLVSLVFESNEIGGNYHMGKPLINIDGGDTQPAGPGNSGTGN
jgi:hypothetical protein